jgi:hypothetical protein
LIEDRIETIRPSTVEDLTCEDIFPDIMLDNMSKFLKKDINELIDCIYNELWTATVLMSSRILETQLKEHITVDLGYEDEPRNIGECIDVLQEEDFSDNFIELLEKLRTIRNDGMHGETRYGVDTSLDIAQDVLDIVMWIYNIP